MLYQQRSTKMIKMRVVNEDGRDELYVNVLKFIDTGTQYLIYTDLSTFAIPVDEVGFLQAWDEASE